MSKIIVNNNKLREILISQTKSEARRRIITRWPDWKQRNAALGLLSQEETQACKNWITAVRVASDQIEQDIMTNDNLINFDVSKSPWWPSD